MNPNQKRVAIFLLAGWILSPQLAVAQPPAVDDAARLEFFERKVRPILANNCYNCHSANNKSLGGLRVDDRNGLIQGGKRGSAVVPGDPEKSLLLQAVHQTGKLKMPPNNKLTDGEIADLTHWIKSGAAWPKVEAPNTSDRYRAKYEKLRKEHWAWQPLQKVQVPTVKDNSWARTEIDRFVLAKLEDKGLTPVKDSERAALIRRVTFDLTGLPPTPEATEAFLADQLPNALEKVVDRLLASPAYGERWGRHWLDVARYGESTGSSRNLPYPQAWRYRDYVIDSFNRDKPYDKLIHEQLAGDLLPAASDKERDENLIATGFLAIGVKDVNQRFPIRFFMDNIDEQIDTVTRSFLALTASCARCHDHKFDPVPTTDYYALAGIFHSTEHCSGLRSMMGGGGLAYYDSSKLLRLTPPAKDTKVDPTLPEKINQLTKAVEAAREDFAAIFGTDKGKEKGPDGRPLQMVARLKMQKLQLELNALTDPSLQGPVALGIRDAKKVGDIELRVRGEAEKLGPVVPRGFLSVINVPGAKPINPAQSGRLELAQWLTHPNNPVTSRVIVNRVWKHLFGQGIVSTVDNFGINGDVPSHPELLDYLATNFVRDGWSNKRLIRTVVLTRAYQLGSEATPAHTAKDPANRLVWRHNPRRLDAEEIRDAALAVSGNLDFRKPENVPSKDFKVIELRNNGPDAQRLHDYAQKSIHRSIYLPLLRGITPRSLEVFDFAEQGMVTGNRETTTVPTQALYLLNDTFVQRQGLALAERLLKRSEMDDKERIEFAYQLALGRDATAKELERAKAYLSQYEADARKVFSKIANQKPATPPKTVEAPAPKKQPGGIVVNPDDVDTSDIPVQEEKIGLTDPRVAAWASFTQAILGSAEFRYLR